MRYSQTLVASLAVVGAGGLSCALQREPGPADLGSDAGGPAPPTLAPTGTAFGDAAPPPGDGGFTTCASAAVEAKRAPLPVDIIWVVDNSASMAPSVAEVNAGLNSFATLVGSKGLDYKVIMLSLKGSGPVIVGGAIRYPVCVPPPLGGADCDNSTHFFHASMDVKSTQPLEQILGTLDQTTGYTAGTERGSVPWGPELRPGATKSVVIVTDDNSRFPGVSFEMFPGGDNPNTSGLKLPVGILHPSRKDPWKGYVFHGLYGWGSKLDPSIRCTYPAGGKPPTSGAEYSALIAKTGGARAQICDGSAAWGPFFDAVATAVLANARVVCEIAIPPPTSGTLDPDKVNVRVDDGKKPPYTVPRVADAVACAGGEGWYYDDPKAPTKVTLCPASCEAAQAQGSKPPKVEILFGCATIIK